MIEIQNVSKRFDSASGEVLALRQVSLSVEKGEFVAMMGPSGSGKSTTMNILGCLDKPTSGTYTLNGQNISDLESDDLAVIRNSTIGFVFQGFNLLQKTSAIENVELPLLYAGMQKKERRERAREALVQMGLEDRLYHEPTQLSGGQQQRVAIARGNVNRAPILMADEPTGNLDSKTSIEIMDIFHELHSQGNTIVLITHDNNVARQAERSLHIFDGRVTEVQSASIV